MELITLKIPLPLVKIPARTKILGCNHNHLKTIIASKKDPDCAGCAHVLDKGLRHHTANCMQYKEKSKNSPSKFRALCKACDEELKNLYGFFEPLRPYPENYIDKRCSTQGLTMIEFHAELRDWAPLVQAKALDNDDNILAATYGSISHCHALASLLTELSILQPTAESKAVTEGNAI